MRGGEVASSYNSINSLHKLQRKRLQPSVSFPERLLRSYAGESLPSVIVGRVRIAIAVARQGEG